MASEKLEIVLKAADRVRELRIERDRMTAEIDRKIRIAESELAALVGEDTGADAATLSLRGEAGEGIQDRIVSIMRRNPHASYDELTKGAYGEVTKSTRNKCRANVYRLRRNGRIQVEDGVFEVLE